MRDDTNATPAPSASLQLLAAWAFVGIPLLWGVSLTLANAVKLFR